MYRRCCFFKKKPKAQDQESNEIQPLPFAARQLFAAVTITCPPEFRGSVVTTKKNDEEKTSQGNDEILPGPPPEPVTSSNVTPPKSTLLIFEPVRKTTYTPLSRTTEDSKSKNHTHAADYDHLSAVVRRENAAAILADAKKNQEKRAIQKQFTYNMN